MTGICWGYRRRSDIHATGVPEGEEKNWTRNI
jgi:hypothetical protein